MFHVILWCLREVDTNISIRCGLLQHWCLTVTRMSYCDNDVSMYHWASLYFSDDSDGSSSLFSGLKSGGMNVATSIDNSSRAGAGIMLISTKPLQGTSLDVSAILVNLLKYYFVNGSVNTLSDTGYLDSCNIPSSFSLLGHARA